MLARIAKSWDIKLVVTQPYIIEIIGKPIARLYDTTKGITTFRIIIKIVYLLHCRHVK